MKLSINEIKKDDWSEVERIYREGIDTGEATLETQTPAYDDWDAKHVPTCRLAARAEGGVLGFVVLGPVSTRAVYSGVAEVSIYVAEKARGLGVGKALMDAVIAASEKEGFWTLQAVVLPENKASLALHRASGFREVGRRERIGRKNGVWRDTVLLERRSRLVGV
ncbi:MAG: N-acetyltransferase family protein [Pseudomonadota bacterium]